MLTKREKDIQYWSTTLYQQRERAIEIRKSWMHDRQLSAEEQWKIMHVIEEIIAISELLKQTVDQPEPKRSLLQRMFNPK